MTQPDKYGDRPYNVNQGNPLIQLVDPTGATRFANMGVSGGMLVTPTGSAPVPPYDEADLSYTGSNLTQVLYKLAGITVATITLTYTGSNLTKVVWS